MENNIEKFDPSKLMQGVRDRIKATFVSLIPEEHWEQLVKKEIDVFFEVKEQWNSREPVSPFKTIVYKTLEELTKEKVKESLKRYESVYWEGGDIKVSEEVAKLITDNSKDIIVKILGSSIQQVINNMRNN